LRRNHSKQGDRHEIFATTLTSPQFGQITSTNGNMRQMQLPLSTFFNAPNHVESGNPATGWGHSNLLPQATLGAIASTGASMRQVQFALKYNF